MAKGDRYHIPHDADTFKDFRIGALCEIFGLEAYSLFWVLLERMWGEARIALPYSELTFRAIRYQCRTKVNVKDFVDKAIEFGLFELETDKFFFSPELVRTRLQMEEEG